MKAEKLYVVVFILILLVAIGVRMVSWPYGISQVNVDEAMTAINAKTMAESGVDMYGTSFPVYLEAWGAMGQSVMLLYFMTFFIKIFGFNMISVRLPLLLMSIISIIVFYDFAKRIFQSKKIALFAMAFVSICPWHLLQSIWSIDCNMFPHFMLVSVYLLYRGVTEKKWLLYLSMVFFALTMYTYGVSIYIVPLFLLFCAIYLLVKKQVTIKELIFCIIIYLLVSGPILTMFVINALKIETDISIGPITIQYFENNARTSDMLFFSENIGQTLITNIKSLLNVFFIQYDHLEWNATRVFGCVYHISLIFFFIAIIWLITNKEDRNLGTLFFGVWLALSVFVGIVINSVNINRINVIWFPILFFSFYGLYIVCKNKKIVTYLLCTIYSLLFIGFSIYLYSSYTEDINMSGCFARKITDAVHYASVTLGKDTFYYSNGSSMYVVFQNALDGVNSNNISDLEEFCNRVQNINENEAFIITGSELEDTNIDLNNYQYKCFGDNYVIYR